MPTPDFFIVGAPKCGTTALSTYLREHPNVFMSWPKEPHFLADDFPHYKRDLPDRDSYLRLFDGAEDRHGAIGEASVWYLYSQVAMDNIKKLNPAARIIAMLRNPVTMVPSLHAQLKWTLDEDCGDLAAAWRLQSRRTRGQCLPARCREPAFLQYGAVAAYSEQVRRIYDQFSCDQVKVILFEDFIADPGSVYRETLNFLGLPDDRRVDFAKINERRKHRNAVFARFTQRPPRLVVAVSAGVKRVLSIERLCVIKKLQKFNSVPEKARLSDAFRRDLYDYFAPDICMLESILERPLTVWRR
jgi:hypothetical protein